MGYYTRYELETQPENLEAIKELRGTNECAGYALTPSGSTGDACKWYGHEEELGEFSLKYPNTKFILSGEGEDQGDVWRKTFINGEVEIKRAKLTWD